MCLNSLVFSLKLFKFALDIPFASTVTVHVLFCAHCIEDSSFIFKAWEALKAISQLTGAVYDTMVSVAI